MIARLKALVDRLARDVQGLAAVEFALIAPIMLLVYFGMVEFSQAYMANRRASHTASIVADLVAQGESTSRGDLNKAFEIGTIIMRPFSSDTLSIRISSVTLDARGRATIDWSRGKGPGLPALARGASVDNVPPGLVSAGESLIIGETHFTYSSSVTKVIRKPLNFRRSYYLRPRVASRINCPDC